MNRFVKDMLMSKYDKRNPYGSQGGYVDNRGYSSTDVGRYSSSDTRGDYNRGYEHPEYHKHEDYNRGRYMPVYDRYDYRERDYGMDYGEYGKLSHKDIDMWEKHLENADGTRGQHFHKDQIESIAKRNGVRVDEMGGLDTFVMVVNMMYADYCDVAKKFGINTPDFFVHMAKAFLEDKDFKGTAEEKLWLYYKCIAEQE